jgi:SH3 domain protein
MTSITKKIIFLLFLLPFAALAEESEQTQPNADTQMLDEPQPGYISDQIYVPLRGSPCPDCRIINKGLITGTKLNVLGYQDDWAMVATQQGQEGWIRTQHISDKQVASEILALETRKISRLEDQNQKLSQDAKRSNKLIKDLRKGIDEVKADRAKISQELANVKSLSANELTLNEQNQKLMKHNHKLQEEMDVLRANLDDLRDNKRNQSFLYGGFVAFLGAVLAAIVPRIRGRKRLSEWH